VLQEGNPKLKDLVEFRDYLKVNTEDRNLYIELKKRLYSENKDNYAGYDSGKSETIIQIKTRAKEWGEKK